MADGKNGRKRGVALLLVGMVLGAALITPASAHVTSVAHSWKKHFLPLAKKVFYTKTQSNTKYLGKTAKAADAEQLDGQDSTAFLGATAKATDAEQLDGQDSTAFLGATAKATDADKLDGVDSSDLMRDDVQVAFATSVSSSDASRHQTVACPGALVAVGGGAVVNGGGDMVALKGSHPAGWGGTTNPPEQWWVSAYETAAYGSNWSLTAYVVCASRG